MSSVVSKQCQFKLTFMTYVEMSFLYKNVVGVCAQCMWLEHLIEDCLSVVVVGMALADSGMIFIPMKQ